MKILSCPEIAIHKPRVYVTQETEKECKAIVTHDYFQLRLKSVFNKQDHQFVSIDEFYLHQLKIRAGTTTDCREVVSASTN